MIPHVAGETKGVSEFRHNSRRKRFEPIEIVQVQPLQHHPLDTHRVQFR